MSGRNYPEIESEPQKIPDKGSLERSLVGFLAFVEKFFTCWDAKEAFVRTVMGVMLGVNLELGLNETSIFCRKTLRVGCFYLGHQSWRVCISSFV